MNIAIIGGGFYGCYFANKLSKNHNVTLFEKNNYLFKEAGLNNQYRLHKGFHYPRSAETIEQTYKGYNKFLKEFSSYLYFPKKNYYVIHKNSQINFKNYISKFSKKFNYSIVKIETIKKLKKPSQFEGAIKTNEGVILIKKLRTFLIKKIKKNCKIKLNCNIQHIDSNTGIITSRSKSYKFDKIFNTTYTNPNLGLNKKIFDIKYELAALLVPNKKIKNIEAITIMDGNFVSLYPRNKNNFSISSVIYTPIKKFGNKETINKILKEHQKKNKKNLIKKKLIYHFNKFVDIKLDVKNSKLEYAIKTKIKNDKNSLRTANFIKNKKTISILCGKLDAAPIIYEQIVKKILYD